MQAEQTSQPLQYAWLFSRGDQSVRVIRLAEQDRPARLIVYGPGRTTLSYEEGSFADTITRQTAIERWLLAEGYQLQRLPAGERRSGRDRRGASRGPDRRRDRPEMSLSN